MPDETRDEYPYCYCWCGHLKSGHEAKAPVILPVMPGTNTAPRPQGKTTCRGFNAVGRDDDSCFKDCTEFVPVEVALFRMMDAVHSQLLDFKMLYAVINEIIGEKKNILTLDEIAKKSRVH